MIQSLGVYETGSTPVPISVLAIRTPKSQRLPEPDQGVDPVIAVSEDEIAFPSWVIGRRRFARPITFGGLSGNGAERLSLSD